MTRFAMMVLMLSIGFAVGVSGGCSNSKKSADDHASQADQPPDKIHVAADAPLSAETRFAAGQVAESRGDFSRAITQYQEALKLDPNNKNTLFRLGGVYTQQKRYSDAIVIWQRYLKATDNSASGYNNLAICYDRAGKPADAEQAFKLGIARDPKAAACRVNYGLMLARRGREAEAIAQLQTVLSPAEVQYNLGAVAEQAGQTDKARDFYKKALVLDPKMTEAQARLAGLK